MPTPRSTSSKILTAFVLTSAVLGLSGCMAYQLGAAVAGAAVNTVSAVGRAISYAATGTSQAVTRTVQQIPARMMYGPQYYPPRQVYVPPPRRIATQQRPRPTPARSQKTKSAKAAKPLSKERKNILEVLPPEILDKMTKDELILQSMVQYEALTNDKDEVIYWDLDGHAGTAMAAAEHRMGSFTCRELTETIKLDTADDAEATQSKATACRTEDVGWSLSF